MNTTGTDALKKLDPSVDILFVGALGRLEMEKIPEAGYKITGLPISGFKRKLSLENITFFWKLWKSMRKAKKIIKEFKPGVGGYASGPIGRAAARSGIPLILQEQNSYAGITNRLLGSKASRICVAYQGMEKYFSPDKILITGNPVRKDVLNCKDKKTEGLEHFGFNHTEPVVLILGGSLGAGTINETLQNSLHRIPPSVQLLWQTGRNYFNRANESVRKSGNSNIRVVPFITKMGLAFGCADIVVSRAGAGTISELAVAAKPVILIPSPNVAEDHQYKNANALLQLDSALLVKDEEASVKLIDMVMELINNKDLKTKLSENIRKYAVPDAADQIANEILKIAGFERQ